MEKRIMSTLRRFVGCLSAAIVALPACGASPDSTASSSAGRTSVATTTSVTKIDGTVHATVRTADGAVFDAARAADGWHATPHAGLVADYAGLPGGGEGCDVTSAVLADFSGDAICFDTAYEFWDLGSYCRQWEYVHTAHLAELVCVSDWFAPGAGGLQATNVAAGSQNFCLSSNPFETAETLPAGTDRPVDANEHFVQDVWVQPRGVACQSLYSTIPSP
jgi:hypothetical protein